MALQQKFTSSDLGSSVLPALVVLAALVAVASLVSVRSEAPPPDPFNLTATFAP